MSAAALLLLACVASGEIRQIQSMTKYEFLSSREDEALFVHGRFASAHPKPKTKP